MSLPPGNDNAVEHSQFLVSLQFDMSFSLKSFSATFTLNSQCDMYTYFMESHLTTVQGDLIGRLGPFFGGLQRLPSLGLPIFCAEHKRKVYHCNMK